MSDLTDLRNELQRGLSVVSDLWSYKTRDWVTCIHAADIDNDGEIEVLAGSRDGRIHALKSRDGECIWKRIVGSKKWIGATIGITPRVGEQNPVSVLVGTQDGKVYALNEDGQTISKDRRLVSPFENDGWAFDRDQDRESFWHSSRYQVCWLAADLEHSSQVVIDSEDHYVYALDYNTGEPLWSFSTGTAKVQAVCCCDIDGDGKVETLVSASGHNLYVLNNMGEYIEAPIDVQGQIHSIYAVDLDKDGKIEILLGVDGKALWLLTLDGQPRFRRVCHFPDRFLGLYVTDVDGDGKNEILVGSEDKYLYVLDANGKEIWRRFLGRPISSLYAVDIDNDGLAEVFVGSHDSKDSRVYALRIHPIKGLNEKIQQLYRKSDHLSPATLAQRLSRHQYKLLQALVTEAEPPSKPVTVNYVNGLLNAREHKLALEGALTLEMQNVEQV